MNAKVLYLFSVLFLFTGIRPLSAQTVEDSLLRYREQTALIVRLPSQFRKIQAMENALVDPQLSSSARARLTGQLELVKQETEANNKAIVAAFREYFSTLPAYFIYDTTHNPLQTVFLDEQLNAGTNEPDGQQIIQLRFGRPRADAGNQAESMVLTDSHLRDLQRPFPKPLMMTGLDFGINKLLAPEIAFEKLLEKRIRKLDRKLSLMY